MDAASELNRLKNTATRLEQQFKDTVKELQRDYEQKLNRLQACYNQVVENFKDKCQKKQDERLEKQATAFKKREQLLMDKQRKDCVVCLDNPRDVVFKPCKHHACCKKCVDTLSPPPLLIMKCPICCAVVDESIDYIDC